MGSRTYCFPKWLLSWQISKFNKRLQKSQLGSQSFMKDKTIVAARVADIRAIVKLQKGHCRKLLCRISTGAKSTNLLFALVCSKRLIKIN